MSEWCCPLYPGLYVVKQRYAQLSYDVLSTLLTKVTAIINSRPLIPVSTDPESPNNSC